MSWYSVSHFPSQKIGSVLKISKKQRNQAKKQKYKQIFWHYYRAGKAIIGVRRCLDRREGSGIPERKGM